MTEVVTFTIDGREVTAPKGTLVIRVAELLGIEIPRFCDHPLLDPAGACRQCLVEVVGQRKPLTACTLPATEGLEVKTQLTSTMARDAQRGIMEFLLINHPLDCPVCDKGGECPLQNQAMSAGRADSRFVDAKRTYPKPVAISSQILLDRERCVLCQRCTRFADQIAGDRFIDLMERSASEQIGVFAGDPVDPSTAEPFNSYFSGNTVQICPVGALTGVQYRFRARPFDLVSAPSVCEHCSAGCALRADHRRGTVLRRLAGSDPAVNEEWNCDKGRWAFQYATAPDRITDPMVRDADGQLRVASWPEALEAAATALRAAKESGVGVLTGGRLTVEDAYAYSKFARVVLGTNDLDFRSRPLSAEESDFLASMVAGTPGPQERGSTAVSYADLETAPVVVLAGLEPEEECPILFLRLRKARHAKRTQIIALAPFASQGMEKLDAKVVLTAPGDEAAALTSDKLVTDALATPGAILLVGERLATVPGGLAAAATLAAETGVRVGWVPRRAGDRGAVEAGCLPNLLPAGGLVGEPADRARLETAWGLAAGTLPGTPGRDAEAILESAAGGRLGGLLIAGVDLGDFPDPLAARAALESADVVVSLETRPSSVTRRADVILPVAAAVEKAGSYLNWEGRVRGFEAVLPGAGTLSDARVLDALAAVLGVTLGCGDPGAARAELASLAAGREPGARVMPPLSVPGAGARQRERGHFTLATWHQLLDLGSLQEGDQPLAGTARTPVVRISKGAAARLGVTAGDPLSVGTGRGAITLPVLPTDMPDDVVWLPKNSPGSTVARTLGVQAGALVEVSSGGVR
jgi:NADH-quinone oxidoreductase subunit G